MAKASEFRLSKAKALELVRSIATDSGNVGFSQHALKRMRQRKVTPKEVLDCLLLGVIVEGPALNLKGDWELALQRMGGGRRLRVAIAIDVPKRVIVITVYED
jgi:Domain of unknown function (DUF4258)